MTHPDPNNLLSVILKEASEEDAGLVRAHVLACFRCYKLGQSLARTYYKYLAGAVFFSKHLGRVVSPFEIMAGRRHN